VFYGTNTYSETDPKPSSASLLGDEAEQLQCVRCTGAPSGCVSWRGYRLTTQLKLPPRQQLASATQELCHCRYQRSLSDCDRCPGTLAVVVTGVPGCYSRSCAVCGVLVSGATHRPIAAPAHAQPTCCEQQPGLHPGLTVIGRADGNWATLGWCPLDNKCTHVLALTTVRYAMACLKGNVDCCALAMPSPWQQCMDAQAVQQPHVEICQAQASRDAAGLLTGSWQLPLWDLASHGCEQTCAHAPVLQQTLNNTAACELINHIPTRPPHTTCKSCWPT
jgi:hypothetical protein